MTNKETIDNLKASLIASVIAALQADGTIGADLSPGDPTARKAAELTAELRGRCQALEELLDFVQNARKQAEDKCVALNEVLLKIRMLL
jgi:hypothetical protein